MAPEIRNPKTVRLRVETDRAGTDQKNNMKTSEPAVFTLVVPEPERRVYAAARTILVRRMKTSAPSLGELILHELRRRKSGDIADEYLDFTGWLPRACAEAYEGKPRRKFR